MTTVAAPIDQLQADMALLKEQIAVIMQQLTGGAAASEQKRPIDMVQGAATQQHPDAMHS